jgi:hypothetical protein
LSKISKLWLVETPKFLIFASYYKNRRICTKTPCKMSFKRSSDERIRGEGGFKNNIRTPMLILGLVMCITYLSLGTYILMNKADFPNIQPEMLTIFAGMLVFYGIYRSYRIYADYF